MRKEPEPLDELLLQQFPKKDPIELEQITKTIEKWLQQKLKDYERDCRHIAKKMGEHNTATLVANAYPRCIEDLLRELNPQAYPIHT